MKTAAFRALAYGDSRSLWRDPLLGWVLALPIGLALLLRILVPRVTEELLRRGGVDLAPYYPVIMGGFLMTAPGVVGMVIGFLLLDERDARTLAALRVTPLPTHHYLAYRIVLPLVLATAATLAGYPLAGLVELPFATLVVIVALASLSAPPLALVLAVMAPNKVAGFAAVKVLNGLNLLPLLAFFVPRPVQFIAGIFPTYWPMRALWSAAAGEQITLFLAAGVVTAAVAVFVSAVLFERKLLRRP